MLFHLVAHLSARQLARLLGVMFFVGWVVKETAIESLREVTSATIEAWRQELSG
jgi:hypothetical protein